MLLALKLYEISHFLFSTVVSAGSAKLNLVLIIHFILAFVIKFVA